MRAWEFSASSSAREVSVFKDTVREAKVEFRAIAGYIAVEYDGKWWIAYVNEIFPQSNEVSVNFLHPHGPSSSYFYSRRPDSLVVDLDDILVQLSPTTVTGWTYHLSEDDTEQETIALQLKTLERFKACQENELPICASLKLCPVNIENSFKR